MHECITCGQQCDCDGEDLDQPAPSDCDCDHDGSGLDEDGQIIEDDCDMDTCVPDRDEWKHQAAEWQRIK